MGKDSKLLRVDLPPEAWDELDKRAAERGLKVGVYAKQVVLNHLGYGRPSEREVSEPRIPDEPKPPRRQLTKGEWDRLQKWLTATDRRPPAEITTKTATMRWAQTQGYKP